MLALLALFWAWVWMGRVFFFAGMSIMIPMLRPKHQEKTENASVSSVLYVRCTVHSCSHNTGNRSWRTLFRKVWPLSPGRPAVRLWSSQPPSAFPCSNERQALVKTDSTGRKQQQNVNWMSLDYWKSSVPCMFTSSFKDSGSLVIYFPWGVHVINQQIADVTLKELTWTTSHCMVQPLVQWHELWVMVNVCVIHRWWVQGVSLHFTPC